MTAPDAPQRICEWSNDPDPGEPSEHCTEVATHTTCDPTDGAVCAKHKCRCSRPLDVQRAPVTAEKSRTSSIEDELTAMFAISEVMKPLDDITRRRVIGCALILVDGRDIVRNSEGVLMAYPPMSKT